MSFQLEFWLARSFPANILLYSLAAVNFFLGCVGVVQVSRIFMWRRSQEGSALEAAKDLEHEAADSAKAVASKAKGAVKSVGEKTN